MISPRQPVTHSRAPAQSGNHLECLAPAWTSRATRRFASLLVSRHDTFGLESTDVIRSFKSRLAEMILKDRQVPKGFPTSFATIARRKLVQLNNAGVLGDLVVPPGNRLEVLTGNLAGKHSIRINDQWRIVFRWTDVGPEEVEITDYH